MPGKGQRNVYFGVNPTIHPVQGAGMASHDDVRGVIALHVDLDPRLHTNRIGERRRMLSRLRRYSPPPSIIVDSGAGYHGFWLLDREYEKIDPASGYSLELFNVRLARQLDGDFCHHINGLMRVPGMINIAKALKASLGRVPSVAKLVEYHERRRYPLHLFAPAEVLEEEELASDSFVGSDQDAEGFTLVSPEECPF